ncbi:hypothetical protein [Crocinitomix catalasitica]|uniref:hypothetical protein n=1 Tax=Crocinitomix catalasitica TaxID=184607 RepID=UPI0004808327|nr:hypothetical protein [Crocinitomix catalasitica]
MKLYIIAFFIATLCFCGCTKKSGCQNESAINYDASATEYDESCVYNYFGVLKWENEDAFLSANDINIISIYFGEVVIGENIKVAEFDINKELNCDADDWIAFNKQYYIHPNSNDKSKSTILSIIDQDGDEIFTSEIELTPNTCNEISFLFK